MQTILMTGFEQGPDSIGNFDIRTDDKRTGAYAAFLYFGSRYTTVISESITEGIFGLAMKAPAINAFGWTFYLAQNDNHGIVGISFVERLGGVYPRLVCSVAGSYVDSNVPFISNTWQYYEGYFKIDNAAGKLQLRMDGMFQGEFTGDTFGTYSTIDQLCLYGNSNGGIYVDDVIVNKIHPTIAKSWPNQARITLLNPNNDGLPSQWTPSTPGSHFSLLTDIPSSEGNIYTQSSEQEDVVGISSVGLSPEAKIIAIKPVVWATKLNSTNPTKIAIGVKKGDNIYYGSDQTLQTSSAPSSAIKSMILNSDPETGEDFTQAGVNAYELAVKSRDESY